MIEKIESIKTSKELTNFIELLIDDLEQNSKEWANITLAQYLEAIKSYIQDSNIANMPTNNLWQQVAIMLYMDKFYE